MAVWLLRRAGIVLTLFFRISYCEYDLLENLHPKRSDPPELTDFLQSVLHKKDEFKKIREAAKHLRLHVSIDEPAFLNDDDNSRGDVKTRISNLKHLNRNFKRPPVYRISKKRHPLYRRSDNSERPINDVYPYMYDDNENKLQSDGREERSSWKDIKERKHKYYTSQRNSKRYRRGLDLTDYSSNKDFERGNIKVFPRSRLGFRIVPGNKYQQKRDISTHKIPERSLKFLKEPPKKEVSISQILGSSPLTERAIPDDYSPEHDILGFKAESLSESDISQRNKKLNNVNTRSEDSEISKGEIKADLNTNKLLFNRNLIDDMKTEKINGGRRKRSMKLNIIDDNNLIKRITQDQSAKSIILTLENGKPLQAKENFQRKTITTPETMIDFECVHKAMHSGKPYIKIHENPSKASDISTQQIVIPDIFIQVDKQHEKQDSKQHENIIKQKEPNGLPLIYQMDAEAISDDHDEHSPEEKKIMLEDVDEPTSALEQYELSTKPYIIGVPRAGDIFSSFDILQKVTGFFDSVDATTNKASQFIVKESKDMVHGNNNKKSLVLIDKRIASVTEKIKEQEKEKMPISQKLKRSNDYDDAIIGLRNKLNSFSQFFDNPDTNPENELIKELSKIKRDTSKSDKNMANLEYTQNNDYYDQDQLEMKPEGSFQGRKLQSFLESEANERVDSNDENSQNSRYGYLDYENGRSNHMKEPGFTENKIRVKRDLTDLFGMSNDEEYSEDLLDDFNPSVKQERSDYTYEEEGDSAVPEKQTYTDKKNSKSKLQNKYQDAENGDNDFTTAQTYNSITTESPTTCGSCNHTFKISEMKVSKPSDNLINRDFNKPNFNMDDKINLDPVPNHNADKTINNFQRDVQCSNCKDSKNPSTKKGKCHNCKASTNSGDDTNCKSCNRKIRSAFKNEQKQSSTIPYSDKLEKITNSEVLDNEFSDEKKYWENLDNSDTRTIRIRSTNQTNSSTLAENSCNKNDTFHSKTAINNTSSEGNNKPAKEEVNADQIVYQFGSHKNKTDQCNDSQAKPNLSHSLITYSSVKENNVPVQERGSKKNINSETEPEEYDTDEEETAGFAHHPLKNKNTHSQNDNIDSQPEVDNVLTHFHTKYNQNEFNHNNQQPEHEELPDLETIADRKNEANFEELFRDNHNEASYQNLPAHSNMLENNNVDMNKKQKTTAERNENGNDAEFSLLAESFKNNKVTSNLRERSLEKNKFENKEDGSSSSQTNEFKRALSDTAMQKSIKTNKEQSYAEPSVSTNTVRNTIENKNENSELLNSVDNFADIVEDEVNNKQLNKRYTNKHKRWNKPDISKKIKGEDGADLHNVETLNGYANDAPFEKFSKLNQGYWKKNSERVIRRPFYSQVPYKKDPLFYQNEHNKKKLSSMTTNLKEDSNYRNRHNSMVSRRRLPYMNTNNLRRIRRDQLSKIPGAKTRYGNFNEHLERQVTKNYIPNVNEQRKPRNKGMCNDKHGKPELKEWISPKGPKCQPKQCLLAQDKGLNPSFGLKPSKGSCNDEAELERGSKDYSQLHDALNGRLASLIVQTTFKRIKEHPQLKSRFSHGLTRQHGYKNEMKDLNAFRNNETEGDVKHTEEMLQQIMTVLNKIILDQVRRRTCKHLPPELQKYLACLTKLTKKVVDEDAKISEEGIPLPLVKAGKSKEKPIDTEQGDFLFNNPEHKPELEADEEEIRKKMKMIRELLNKYKHMSNNCKIKVEDVEAYLKKHLCLLKKILKEIKEQRAAQGGKAGGLNTPNKLKRKNYDVPPTFDVKQPDFSQYNPYTKIDLINKQLDSIGLGPSRTYKPVINLDKFIEDAKFKIKYKSSHDSNPRSSKNHAGNSKSRYRNEDDTLEQLEDDYENPKNEHKRETVENENTIRRTVSEKYRKLVQAAEILRRKRASEERLGKLFGKSAKRSVRNENYDTIKSMNKKYQDYSHVRFETPVVFSLKK